MAAVFPADVRQLLVIEEEVPHECSLSLDHHDSELLHIKEEEEELWNSEEGEQLNGLEESITEFPFTAVQVKSEDDEQSQSLPLHQSQTESNSETETPASSSAKQMKIEDCGIPELVRDPHPDSHLQSNKDGQPSESSETEVSDDDNDHWQEPLSDCGSETEDSRVPESGVNNDVGGNVAKKSLSCSECGKRFLCKLSLQKHVTCHSKKLVNNKSRVEQSVDSQMKRFGCDDCGKRFNQKKDLRVHMRVHTGERPFGCADCGKRFRYQGNLKMHIRVHADEKPFGCAECGQRFSRKTNLTRHMRVHTGEKPFGCDNCGQRFNHKANLKIHIRVHTGEKPFSCDVCGQKFYQKTDLKRHENSHRGETICL